MRWAILPLAGNGRVRLGFLRARALAHFATSPCQLSPPFRRDVESRHSALLSTASGLVAYTTNATQKSDRRRRPISSPQVWRAADRLFKETKMPKSEMYIIIHIEHISADTRHHASATAGLRPMQQSLLP